jgi:hypothetical protein
MSAAVARTPRRTKTTSSESKREHERYVEFADALGIEDASTKTIEELKLIIGAAVVDFEGLEKLAEEMESEAESLEKKAKEMAIEAKALEKRAKQVKAKIAKNADAAAAAAEPPKPKTRSSILKLAN